MTVFFIHIYVYKLKIFKSKIFAKNIKGLVLLEELNIAMSL